VDGDIADLPNDIDALKAALTVERAKLREVVAERDAGAAELAVARAKASEDRKREPISMLDVRGGGL